MEYSRLWFSVPGSFLKIHLITLLNTVDHIIVPGLKAQSIDYFSKQIDLCVDNKMFGTAWTNHTIMPGIMHKDKRPTRPSFKSDVSGKNRFFAGASSSTMEKYEK